MSIESKLNARLLTPVLLNTVLALSALYAPQPLLPTLSQTFTISREAAAGLTTVTFIPLAIAPLLYGYLLESISATQLLKIAVPLLALSELLFAWAGNYPLLMIIRLFQGLLIPAILTGLMTYISQQSSSSTIQRSMSIYIAATIFGGFIGRAASGLIATWFGWRYSFIILAISLAIGFLLLFFLPDSGNLKLNRPAPKIILQTLQRPAFLPLYLAIFCLFFVFAAMMNFIPFRLTELSSEANELRIGLMYSGYMMGICTSLGAPAICRKLGGQARGIQLGLLAYGVTLFGLAFNQIWMLFATMFLFCGAMFLVHSTASGLINQLAGEEHRGLTNGIYVAFYYAGGAIGSFAPGLLYRQSGWYGFLVALLIVCLLGYLCSRRIILQGE
ncbi:MFS transporter, YNFM family, putative membrane transport protein [Malonomonas rubra DSM 5091]|uniref:MFS transporter, YNFM family, putative membrane transport protein n=1 Tax=Malonomonas rubra DSM 5091 TaxID=1122189 RepID=A0A1M6GQH1_MALRU|nr:MFS transporter [Malonomonas rubra]SHJ12211.1 MFS transporter, YNFM family, putative membrane transport protein [Malonomonas rubra DSM 5091]